LGQGIKEVQSVIVPKQKRRQLERSEWQTLHDQLGETGAISALLDVLELNSHCWRHDEFRFSLVDKA
jgi:hypothetical protein